MRLFRHHPAEVLGDEVEEPRPPPRRYKRPPPREAPAAPPRAEAPAASVASIVGPGEHAAALARGGASSDLRAGGGTPRAATPLNRPASARPEGGRPATAPRPVSAAGQPVRYLSEEQRAQLNAKYGTLEAPPWAPRPEEVSEHVDAARREERARADADYARVQEFLEMEERRRAHASARETPAAADETTRAGCRPPHRRRRRAAPSSFVASLFRACTPSQPLAQAGAAFGLGAAAAALVLAFAVEAASRSEYAERFVSSVVDQLQLAGRVYLRRLTQAADAVSWCIHLATLIVRFVTHFFLAFYRYPRYGWTLFCLVTAGDAARRRWNTANLIREAFTTVDEALGPHRASIIGLCFLSWVIFGEASYVYALPRQFLTEYWDDFRWACLRSQAFLWACTQLWPHAKRLGRVCRLAPQVIALRLQIVWLTIPLHKIVLLVVLLAQPLVDWCVYWPFFFILCSNAVLDLIEFVAWPLCLTALRAIETRWGAFGYLCAHVFPCLASAAAALGAALADGFEACVAWRAHLSQSQLLLLLVPLLLYFRVWRQPWQRLSGARASGARQAHAARRSLVRAARLLTRRRVVQHEPSAGDACPVCLDDLTDGRELAYCKWGCGRPIHAQCLEDWRGHRNADGLTRCLVCNACM